MTVSGRGDNGRKAQMVQLAKYNRHGCRVRAKPKYKAVLQQIAWCHDTGTRFSNEECAARTGWSGATVERVIAVLDEAGVVTITRAGSKHRQVRLASHWLDQWRGRFPQVAKLRDGKRGNEVKERRKSGAFEGAAETANPIRAEGVEPPKAEGVAPPEPPKAEGHNSNTGDARETEAPNGTAIHTSHADQIDHPGSAWEPYPWWAE
ncbi:hypothetical protein [Ruegeria sp. B32]|uniref:hypothetical protein n=1 Tax=Ruegeria sp. B32 TaxID=2867020 RepID=UPI0021A49C2A|nr:hypothetical protein [Ruegeria sp. B32]UWR06557.1 hypothetical protein K3752_13010 [Ruegeria sp. B32]